MPPKKGPSSKGVGITSGLTQPVRGYATGDLVTRLENIYREAGYGDESTFERSAPALLSFFQQLGTPMRPGQTFLGKIGEAGPALSAIKPAEDTPKKLAAKVGAEFEVEKELETLKAELEPEDAYKAASPEGKILADYNAGVYGEVGSEIAIQRRDEALANEKKSGMSVLPLEEQIKFAGAEASIANLQKYVNEQDTLLDTTAADAKNNIIQADNALVSLQDAGTGSFISTRANLLTLADTVGLDVKAPDLYEAIKAVTVGKGKSLASTEVTNAVNQMFTLYRAKFLPNNLNQQEIKILQEAGPQLFMTKEGQELLLNIAKRDSQVAVSKKQAFDNFMSTGKLTMIGDDGKEIELLNVDAEALTGIPSLVDQRRALNLINGEYTDTLVRQNNALFKEQLDKVNAIEKPYDSSFINSIPEEFTTFTKQTDSGDITFNVKQLYGDGNLFFVGYSDDNKNFSFDETKDGSIQSITTSLPNQPVYIANTPQGAVLIDFRKYLPR